MVRKASPILWTRGFDRSSDLARLPLRHLGFIRRSLQVDLQELER